MNCEQAIEYIHSLERFGIKPGLGRIGELCRLLGNPQDDCRFIHVAGTNGKGSACSFAAGILLEAGYTVGLYTSPYVTDFRERIMYCGNMIEPEELAFCVEKVKTVSEENGITATEFEAVTAAALLYYSRKKCDWVVLETGLGGRFDATNIISAPEAAVIMSVSLDHMAILGDTVEKIAAEKCGIIKDGCTVVSYPLQRDEALRVIEKTCAAKGCRLVIPDATSAVITGSDLGGTSVNYGNLSFRVRLPGIHMVYNAITAIETVRACLPDIPGETISAGISKTVMPARTEVLCTAPVVILDGGHNEDCAAALGRFIDGNLCSRRIIMVSALMADKDYDTYLRILAPRASAFIATGLDMERCLPAAELCRDAEKYCGSCECVSVPLKAVDRAIFLAGKNGAVIVCGSFYLAGEVRDYLIGRCKNEQDG